MLFDTTTESGQRVQRRLQEEEVVWLTTVRRDGQPIPVPSVSLGRRMEMLIYSAPALPTTRHRRTAENFDQLRLERRWWQHRSVRR